MNMFNIGNKVYAKDAVTGKFVLVKGELTKPATLGKATVITGFSQAAPNDKQAAQGAQEGKKGRKPRAPRREKPATDVSNNKPEKSIGQEIHAQDIDVESALGAMAKTAAAALPTAAPSEKPAPTEKPWAAQAAQEKEIRKNITELVKYCCSTMKVTDTAAVRQFIVNHLASDAVKDTLVKQLKEVTK